jgi:PAS domain-containing protein
VHLDLQRLRRALEAEVRLRQHAEARLEQSLAQAVLVTNSEGRIVFCTRRAHELLEHYLDNFDPDDALPAVVLEGASLTAFTHEVDSMAAGFRMDAITEVLSRVRKAGETLTGL